MMKLDDIKKVFEDMDYDDVSTRITTISEHILTAKLNKQAVINAGMIYQLVESYSTINDNFWRVAHAGRVLERGLLYHKLEGKLGKPGYMHAKIDPETKNDLK